MTVLQSLVIVIYSTLFIIEMIEKTIFKKEKKKQKQAQASTQQ